MKRGKLGRLVQLSTLTAKVSSSYLGSKLQENFLSADKQIEKRLGTNLKNAKRIVETLGELKGLVMKFGQMMSIQADLFPKEVLGALSKLQQQAPPVEFADIAKVIAEEFGKPYDQVFDHFDEKPFRSASIGQVHLARTKEGCDVIVKIQYPGISDVVQSDLDTLKMLVKSFEGLSMKSFATDKVYEELRDRISEELDYKREAENLKTFRLAFIDDPRIVIPEVYEGYTTRRVLTLSYIAGDSLDRVISDYTQEQRDLIGYNLLGLIFKQCIEVGLIHSDPHPGNFVFFPDGRIAFFDFGCVKYLSEQWRHRVRRLVKAIHLRDYPELEEVLIEMGAYRKPEKRFGPELYEPYLKVLNRIFSVNKVYDFGKYNLVQVFLRMGRKDLKHAFDFKPIAEVVLLDRMMIGQYTTLKELNAKGCFGKIVEAYLD